MPRIVVPESFARSARRKPPQLRLAIAKCVELLGDNPRHPGLNTHQIQGRAGVWEAYIDRANRVTFHRDGDTIVLRKNCRHDILRRP